MRRFSLIVAVVLTTLLAMISGYAQEDPPRQSQDPSWDLVCELAGFPRPWDQQARDRALRQWTSPPGPVEVFGRDRRDLNAIRDPLAKISLVVAVVLAHAASEATVAVGEPPPAGKGEPWWTRLPSDPAGEAKAGDDDLPADWPVVWRERLASWLRAVARDRQRFLDGGEPGGWWNPSCQVWGDDPGRVFMGRLQELAAPELAQARRVIAGLDLAGCRNLLQALPEGSQPRCGLLLPDPLLRIVAEPVALEQALRDQILERMRHRPVSDPPPPVDKEQMKSEPILQGDDALLFQAYSIQTAYSWPLNPDYLPKTREAIDLYERYVQHNPRGPHVPWVSQQIEHLYRRWWTVKTDPPAGFALDDAELERRCRMARRVACNAIRGFIHATMFLDMQDRENLLEIHCDLVAMEKGGIPTQWWPYRPFDDHLRKDQERIDPWYTEHHPGLVANGHGVYCTWRWQPMALTCSESEMAKTAKACPPAVVRGWIETRLLWSLQRDPVLSEEELAYYGSFPVLRNALHWVLADRRNGAYGRPVDNRIP
jgi:hypothetical protein